MKKTDKSLLPKISISVLVIAGILMLILLGSLCSTANVQVQQSGEVGDFYRVREYTFKQEQDADAPGGIRLEYGFAVSQPLAYDSSLVFYTEHKAVEVYLEDSLVYSLKPAEDISFVKTVGSNWVRIPLYREDAGKQIRVVITPAYGSVRGSEVTFLIGSALEIYMDQLRRDMPQLVLSGLTFFVGIGFLCIAGYSLLVNRKGKDLLALGVFAVVLGLWKFSTTAFSSVLIADKPVFLSCLSVAALMVGVLPLVRAMKVWYDETDSRILDGYCIAAAGISIVQLLLQLFGVTDLEELYPVTCGVIIVGVLLIIGNAVFVRIKFPGKYRRFSARDFSWILGAGVLADIVAYNVKGTASGLMFTLVAFLCYAVVAGVFNHAEQVRMQRENKRLLAEKDQQLVQSRITTMMSQIRSHFVFNILNAISGMCKYDPEKADKTVVRFARYLRANIDIMQDDQAITFHSDLRHVEDYVALEQVRFGDQIQFVTDITVEQFLIPPLILQPIVENAIKHGLTPKPAGGTITLRTWADDSNIYIAVQDDGVGFDPGAMNNDKSVGLKNVRYRLQYTMHGSLNIESTPGKGTTVTISIPREEAERCV